jgi:hypothetical protein
MGSPRRLLLASRALLLLAPLLVPLVLPLGSLPPGLAFALTSGRWLIVLGAAAGFVAMALAPKEAAAPSPARSAGRGHLFAAAWACGFALFLALVPSHRWSGASLTGDEPKYLRMARSLYHDLDVDMASETQQDVDARLLRRNLKSFAEAARVAVADLHGTRDGAAARSTGHNWTIEGRHGGRYYVQSPGLPVVLLPAVALQPRLTQPWLLMLTLAALWATALAHTVRLCAEAGVPADTALLAAGVAMLSPPALIGGMHFYPESAALPAVAWATRFARPEGPPPGRARAIALAAALGALPWLHPKLIPLAAVLALLLAARLRREPKAFLPALAAFLLPVLGLLLFDHHVTGLARPDALYVVYGSEVYSGPGAILSPRLLTGFVNGLFAARDGLLVMAPGLIAGVLALPVAWRRGPRTALALGAVFAAVWFAAAVHEGGAPGPPARLMAPAAPLLAVPLAIGLRELGRGIPFRWTFVGLALVTLSITWAFRVDWLRTNNPYRDLPAETNFAPDLPDGPRDLATSPPAARRLPDLLRGLLLAATLAAWSWMLCRRPRDMDRAGPATAWPSIRDLHLGWWATILVLSFALHALGP